MDADLFRQDGTPCWAPIFHGSLRLNPNEEKLYLLLSPLTTSPEYPDMGQLSGRIPYRGFARAGSWWLRIPRMHARM